MTAEKAREEFPMWALGSPLEEDEYPQQKEPFFFPAWLDEFRKKHTVAILCAVALTVWTVVTCVITGTLVHHNTEIEVTERVTHEMKGQFQAYLDQQEQNRMASSLLVGEASRQAAVDELTELFARHIAGLRMDRGVSKDGAITYIWGVDIPRYLSGRYGSTMEEVLESNLECYTKDHSVRSDDRAIAREIAEAFMAGERPSRWIPSLEFAEIHGDGSVEARNELFTGRQTRYWTYEGM